MVVSYSRNAVPCCTRTSLWCWDTELTVSRLCWNTELTGLYWSWNAKLRRLAFWCWNATLRSPLLKSSTTIAIGTERNPHVVLLIKSAFEVGTWLYLRSAFAVGREVRVCSWMLDRLRSASELKYWTSWGPRLRLERGLHIWQRTRGSHLGQNAMLTFGMRLESEA